MTPERLHPGRKALFQHFPCTGGSEMFSVIEELYGRHSAALYHDSAERNCDEAITALVPGSSVDLVTSHVAPLGPLPAHIEMLTFYRDPIERALSQHYFACRQARAQGVAEPVVPARAQWPDSSLAGSNYYLLWACRLAGLDLNGGDLVDGTSLAVAKAVIDRGYVWIGITERFQDSLRLLAKVLDWPRLPVSTPQEQVKSGRARTADLDPEIVAWATHITMYDQILYRKAVARFEQMWADSGLASSGAERAA